MSITFLNVVHCIIAVFLTIIVLVQPGKGGGLVMGGGTSQSLFGASGGGNFFTKVTTVLAILFVITSTTITRMNSTTGGKSIFDATKTEVTTEVNDTPAPTAPLKSNAPVDGASNSENGAAAAGMGAETEPSTTKSAPSTKNE